MSTHLNRAIARGVIGATLLLGGLGTASDDVFSSMEALIHKVVSTSESDIAVLISDPQSLQSIPSDSSQGS